MSSNSPPQAVPAARPRRRWGRRLVLLAALLLGLGLLPVGPPQALLRVVLRSVLTRRTGRAVEVGRVHHVLLRGVAVEGLTIPGSPEPVLHFDRAVLRWNLFSLLRHRREPLLGIRSISVDGLDLELRRTADGQFELLRLFEPPHKKPARPFRWGGRVTVRDGRLRFRDAIAPPAPRLPAIELDRLAGSAQFDGRGGGEVDLVAAAPGLAREVRLEQARLVIRPFGLQTALAVRELDLAAAGRLGNPLLRRWVTLRGGQVTQCVGQLAVTVTPPAAASADRPQVDLGLDLRTELAAASLGTPQLGLPLTADGVVRLTLPRRAEAGRAEQLRAEGLLVTLGARQVRVDGSLTAPRQRRELDLRLRSTDLPLAELPLLLPRLRPLRALRASGASGCDLRLRGTAAALQVQGWVTPGAVAYGPLGAVYGGRLAVDLQRVPPAAGVAGLRGVVELERLAVRSPRLGDGLSQLAGRVRLGADELAFEPLQALAGDAPVRLAGRLRGLRAGRREVDLQVATSGLRLEVFAPLVPAAWRPSEVAGPLTADLRLRGQAAALSLTGRVVAPPCRLPRLRHLGGSYDLALQLGSRPVGRIGLQGAGVVLPEIGAVEQVDGQVLLASQTVTLQDLRARYGGGRVRATGQVALDGQRFDLRVAAAGVDLQQATGPVHRRGIRGRGPLTADLRLAGTPQQLRVDGTARVPWLQVPGVTLRAERLQAALAIAPRAGLFGLAGRLRLSGTQIAASAAPAPVWLQQADLRFDRGAVTVASARGTVHDDPLALSGELTFQNRRRPQVAALDLTVQAPRVREATRRRFVRLVPALAAWRLDQPAGATLRLTGRPPAVHVSGGLRLPALTRLGPEPLRLAATAAVDLQLRQRALPLGTVRLSSGAVQPAQVALPLTRIRGELRLGPDGRLTVSAARPLLAQLGGTAVRALGSVDLRARQPLIDLTVASDAVLVADLQALTRDLREQPEFGEASELGPLAVRLVGTPDDLRVSSVGPGGEPGGTVAVPPRLGLREYVLEGGRAGFDLRLRRGRVDSGQVDLAGTALTVPQTGTRVALDTGRLRLRDGWIEETDLRAAIAGRPLRIAGRPRGPAARELALRVIADDLALAALLPRQEALAAQLGADTVRCDLTLTGPPDDLAVAGRVQLAAGELPPVEAAVHLRLVQPLEVPGGGDSAPQLLGGLRLTGGSLPLRDLAEPLTDLRGELQMTRQSIVLREVRATLGGAPVSITGRVADLPEPVLDLAVELPGNDLGAVLAALRLPSPEDPDGPRRDLFSSRGLPRLLTPELVRGRLQISGPLDHVAIVPDLTLPLLSIAAADALPAERGLGAADPQRATRGAVLARGVRVTGVVSGSLRPVTAELPARADVASGLGRLAGRHFTADPPELAAASEASLLDHLVCGLHVSAAELDARQGFAFLSDEAQRGVLASAYQHQPARLEVDLSGALREPRLTGRLESGRLEFKGVPARRLVLAFDYFDHLMTLSELAVDLRAGRLQGHGALRLVADQPLDMTATLVAERVELAALNQVDTLRDKQLGLGGVLDGDLLVHLSDEVPRATGLFSVEDLTFRGQRLGSGNLDAAVEHKSVRIRDLDLADPTSGARVRVRGRADLDPVGALDLVTDIAGVEVGRFADLLASEAAAASHVPLVSGNLELVGHLTGTRQVPLLDGTAGLAFGALRGYPFHRLRLRSVPVGQDAMQLTLDLSDSAWRAEATGQIKSTDAAAGEFSYGLDAKVQAIELHEAVPLAVKQALGPSFGQVSGSAQLTGRVARVANDDGSSRLNPLVDLTGEVDLRAGRRDQPLRLQIAGVDLDTARLRLRAGNDELLVEALEVTVGDTRIGIDPARRSRLTQLGSEPQAELFLTSDQLRYEDLERLTGLPLRTTGTLGVTAAVAGPLRDPVTDVEIATQAFTIAGSAVGDRRLRARIARGVTVLEQPETFDLFGTAITVSGALDRATVQANVDLVISDFEKLRGFLSSLTQPVGEQRQRPWQLSLQQTLDRLPQPLAGRFSAALRLAGPRQRPVGYLLASAPDLHSGDRPLPPTEVLVNLGTTRPRLPERFDPGVCYVYGAAIVGLDNAASALRLQARASNLELAPYAGWSPRLAGLRGRLELAGAATGSLDEPRLELQRLTLAGAGAGGLYLHTVSAGDVVWQPGELQIGELLVRDGTLEASLSGALPTPTRALKLADDGPLDLTLRGGLGNLAEFAALYPALGQVIGRGEFDLHLGGRLRAADVDGKLELAVPRLQLIEPPETVQVAHTATEPSPLGSVLSVLRPALKPSGPVLSEWSDAQLTLQIQDNVIEVADASLQADPTGGGLAQKGRLEIEPGGRIGEDRPLDLRAFTQGQQLWALPANLRLRAVDFAARTKLLRCERVNLDVEVAPVFDGQTLNRVTIRRGDAWVNGGFATASGTVDMRSPDLGHWEEHRYDLTVQTPPLSAGSAPPGAGSAINLAGQPVFAPTLAYGAAGSARLACDLRLVTREGQTPPLTLAGRVDVVDGLIGEGVLALLLGGRGRGQPANWPANMRVDVALNAVQNNWIRAKVPELTVPIAATVKLSDTPQQLRADGTAEVGDGQLATSLLKNRVNVRGGSGSFTLKRNPLTGAFAPFANFVAKAETALYEDTGGGDRERIVVNLEISGTARPGRDQPVETNFTVRADSTPPLPEERIFAMLSRKAEFATALTSGKMQAFLRQELANAAVQTALSYALTPVFNELRELLGLDVLTVRYELDRPLEVQVSKQIVKRLFLTFFVEVGGASGSKQTVKVDYDVGRGVRVGAEFDSDRDFRITAESRRRF
ncbi:MAG: translocation/assembly module TamB domain-containing protein [Fimbriimonadaceae bacterium]|nr:translocation/assembly module TamB domain-containing protein [Fimbriimonadaceae bacterium]